MVSVAYYLSKRSNTEIICSIFVNPRNNMISDMLVRFFDNFKEKMCVEAFPLMKLNSLYSLKEQLKIGFQWYIYKWYSTAKQM